MCGADILVCGARVQKLVVLEVSVGRSKKCLNVRKELVTREAICNRQQTFSAGNNSDTVHIEWNV
jgi:hypothetical protein